MSRPAVLLLGPGREEMRGATAHLDVLLASPLGRDYALSHREAVGAVRLLAGLARRGAAIVHLNTSLEAGEAWRELACVAAAKLAGARVVVQVHGGALPRAAARAALRLADAVVVAGKAALDAYRALLPRQDVVRIPGGVDCALYLKHGRPPRDPEAPLRLVFVGRLVRAKGVYELVEALACLRARRVAVRLLIAGRGPEEARLRHRVRELGLMREVTFVGPVKGEHKARLLALADAFVLPSHREGLPFALLEAMAAGTVPIVTRAGAMPELVDDGVHGLLVPPGDPGAIAEAAARLAADTAALVRMSAACRGRIAEGFSAERAAEALRALYSSVIDRHVRNRRLDRRGAQRA